MTLRILHLNTTDIQGGAARGAYWLHQALRPLSESRMLVQQKFSRDDSVLEYRPRWSSTLSRHSDRWVLRRYEVRRTFSPAALRLPVHRQVNALRPDVVNLHWIGNGFLSPESMVRIRAPLVWTLRDLWTATGGCHYTAGCERFLSGCGRCPQLGSTTLHDPSWQLYRRKARAWQHWRPALVALSRWVAQEVERAPLLAGCEVSVIPNALDTATFSPYSRAQARAEAQLPAERKLLLFVALNPLGDPRKGFEHLRRACEQLARRADAPSLEVLVVGPTYTASPPQLALRTRYLGEQRDDQYLARLYAAADLTVMPSLEEAFGKVALESLSCGTPVAAYGGTGVDDIVVPGEHGELAALGDPAALAHAVATLLDHPDPARLAAQARRHVLSHFTYERQAQAYRQLYERVWENWMTSAASGQRGQA